MGVGRDGVPRPRPDVEVHAHPDDVRDVVLAQVDEGGERIREVFRLLCRANLVEAVLEHDDGGIVLLFSALVGLDDVPDLVPHVLQLLDVVEDQLEHRPAVPAVAEVVDLVEVLPPDHLDAGQTGRLVLAQQGGGQELVVDRVGRVRVVVISR